MRLRFTPIIGLALVTLAGTMPHPAEPYSLAGYASATSVVAGDTLGFHVSSDYSSLTLRFYRQCPDPELLLDRVGLVPENVPVPDSSWINGCQWPTLFKLTIPPEWPSGLYQVELVPPGGGPIKHVPFVVRGPSAAPKPILILSAVNTYQAYNAFGGKSLYDFNSPGGRAPRVTFDRPYDSHDGLGQPQFEVPFERWFERAGFTADYATDVDLALTPEILNGRRLLIIVGHSEYWTRSMYNAVETFVNSGGNAAFLGGNTCYWQVRYEDAGHTLVCYKSNSDPMFYQQIDLTTVTWRGPLIRRPECILVGVMYPYCGGTASDSILFARPYSWVTEGLEDQVGNRFGPNVVGYEFDTYFDGRSPSKAVKLFETPIAGPECEQVQATTYYERQPAFGFSGNGGGIFAAGTIQWSWGLDDTESGAADPRMQLLTTNLIRGLSQPLYVQDPGTAVIRAHVDGASVTRRMPIEIEPVHVGRDTTSLGVSPMLDNGVWPDAAADDSIYTGQFQLNPGDRLPLLLKFSCANSQKVTTRTAHDYFWLADTQFADEFYFRALDSLLVEPDLVAVPPLVASAPFRLALAPNPFVASLRLSWDSGFVVRSLIMYDMRGRLVARLPLARGASSAVWDGRDAYGHAAPAGIYWACAECSAGKRVARVVKLR